MKRMTIMLVALALTLLTVTPAIAAANPKFMAKFTTATLDGNNLDVDFKMSGLGSFATVDIEVTATATRLDACVNGGGNVPSDAKKTATTAVVSDSGTFPVRNGQVTGSLTLMPPATSLSCPPGQQATLFSVSYTNVVISGAGVSHSIGGTFG